jgi:hypothetical protein
MQDPGTLISFELPEEHLMRFLTEKWGAAVAQAPETAERVAESRRDTEERVWASFRQSEGILRDTYHLYPGYCDVPEDGGSETDVRNIAFFNDRLLLPERGGGTATSGAPETPPHWLFILSTADCDIQAVFEGETGFVDVVASKLVETRAAGRHPILIGPKAFVVELTRRMPTADGIDVLSQCPFTQFMSLLLSAEYAFYWNVVSHSLLIRLYNQLPIFMFDRGHLIRTAPAIHDRIVAWYYQGWEPLIRDHREPLTLETVAGWTDDYRREAARLVQRFRRAPSPDDMIARLMDATQMPEMDLKVSSR